MADKKILPSKKVITKFSLVTACKLYHLHKILVKTHLSRSFHIIDILKIWDEPLRLNARVHIHKTLVLDPLCTTLTHPTYPLFPLHASIVISFPIFFSSPMWHYMTMMLLCRWAQSTSQPQNILHPALDDTKMILRRCLFPPTGHVLISGASDGLVAISSPTTGMTMRVIHDHKGAPITDLQVAPLQVFKRIIQHFSCYKLLA